MKVVFLQDCVVREYLLGVMWREKERTVWIIGSPTKLALAQTNKVFKSIINL